MSVLPPTSHVLQISQSPEKTIESEANGMRETNRATRIWNQTTASSPPLTSIPSLSPLSPLSPPNQTTLPSPPYPPSHPSHPQTLLLHVPVSPPTCCCPPAVPPGASAPWSSEWWRRTSRWCRPPSSWSRASWTSSSARRSTSRRPPADARPRGCQTVTRGRCGRAMRVTGSH